MIGTERSGPYNLSVNGRPCGSRPVWAFVFVSRLISSTEALLLPEGKLRLLRSLVPRPSFAEGYPRMVRGHSLQGAQWVRCHEQDTSLRRDGNVIVAVHEQTHVECELLVPLVR